MHLGRNLNRKYTSGEFALTIDEINLLLNSIENIHEKALIALNIVTGLRREDIVSLKRENYNPSQGTIEYYEHKKNKQRILKIPSKTVISLLDDHLEESPVSIWVFPSPRFPDRHISSRHYYDRFNELLNGVGLQGRPLHCLRATCYQLALNKGWNAQQGSKLLGNKVGVSETHYNTPYNEINKITKEKPLF